MSSDAEGRVEPGIVLGDGHPGLGPDVRLVQSLMISCLLSSPDGVGDRREPCLAQVGASSVEPTTAEGLLSTQPRGSCGGCCRGGPQACSCQHPPAGWPSIPPLLSLPQDTVFGSDLSHDLAVAQNRHLTPNCSPSSAPEILSILQIPSILQSCSPELATLFRPPWNACGSLFFFL